MAKKKTKENIELIAYSTDASMIPGNAAGVVFPTSAESIAVLVR